MRSIFLGLLFCAAVSAQAVRVDPRPAYTVRGNTPVGAMGQVLAVPGTSVSICVDAGCSSSPTSYNGPAATTPCPSSAPINPAGTTSCAATTDNQGNWGMWVLPGTYYFKFQFPTGATFGPFPITAGGSGGGGGGTGTPGLPANSIQFNAAGAFAGSSNLSWNNATRQETITSTPGVAGLNVAIGFVLSNQGFVADPAGSTTFNAIRAVSGGVAALSLTATNYTNAGHYDTLMASGPPITAGDITNPGALSYSTLGGCLAVYNGTSWTCLGAGGAGNVVTASGVVVNGQCAQFNGVGNQVVSVACAGGGAGSGTVAAGSAGQLAFYTATGTTVGGAADFTFNGATHVLASSATGSIDLHLAPTTGLTLSAGFPSGALVVAGGSGVLSSFALSGLGAAIATTPGGFGPGNLNHIVVLNGTGDFVDSGIAVGGGGGATTVNGLSGPITLAQTLGEVLVSTGAGTITLSLPATVISDTFQALTGFLALSSAFNAVNVPNGGVAAKSAVLGGHLTLNGPAVASAFCSLGGISAFGNDAVGSLLVTSTCTGSTAIQVTFSGAYGISSAPVCLINAIDSTGFPLPSVSVFSTNTAFFTIKNAAGTGIPTGSVINYICIAKG
jgi:hypothetical protein